MVVRYAIETLVSELGISDCRVRTGPNSRDVRRDRSGGR
jgi:hypothetical protein